MMKNVLVAALWMIAMSIGGHATIGLVTPVAAAEPAEGQNVESKDAEPKNLLKPTNELDSWLLELTDGGKGEMKVDEDAIVFDVLETDGTNWHVQAYQTEVPLKDGKIIRSHSS